MPTYKNIKPCERLNNWEILAVTPTKMRSPDGYTKISQTFKEQQQKKKNYLEISSTWILENLHEKMLKHSWKT